MCNEVSLCMIVKNEEDYLSRCLESVKDVVDEIIIVDTGSTDRTVEIAKSFGAKIYYFKWNNNFSEARNVSLKYATKDWILILDADDELKPKYRDTFKLFLNSELDAKAVYFFETLNYYGNEIREDNITVNLNPRVFKNCCGIHYEGEIHNQLIHSDNEYDAICEVIKIHHYGYMNQSIKVKDKRNRNISILNKLVEEEPDNKFNYFNLGNEYSALDDYKKALECYYKAYEDFRPNIGYSATLLLRIIISNYNIKEYTKALHYIDIAIEYYPKFTDVYFFKALVYKDLDKPIFVINALSKCIEIGEAPSTLKFFDGSGSYKAFYELGVTYMKLRDYDNAYINFCESIKLKPDYVESIYGIVKALRAKNTDENEFKAIMNSYFVGYIRFNEALADIFYKEGYYKIALEYVEKCEKENLVTDNIIMIKAKCLIRIGAFDECIQMSDLNTENLFYPHISMYKVLSYVLKNELELASTILKNFKTNELSDLNKKLPKVYFELIKIFNNEATEILADNEGEREYYTIILEICEILLVNLKFDELNKAVNLFNLIDNKFALILLGKLYFNYSYIDIAKTELLRSIKEFGIYDNESLEMLKE